MFPSTRHLLAGALAIAGMAAAVPASAQVVQSLHVGVGGFFPRGFESRSSGDVLVADLTDTNPLLFVVSDFHSGQVFGEWNVGVGDHVEVGIGAAFSQRTVPSVYADLVNGNREIEQRLRLRMAPITGVVRFLPLGRPAQVQPYIGVGLAAVTYNYQEEGDFVDVSDGSIFSARFTTSGVAPGAVVLGGVRLPLGGDIYGLTLEGRYQFANGHAGADKGFLGDTIDLSGGSFNFGFLVRF